MQVVPFDIRQPQPAFGRARRAGHRCGRGKDIFPRAGLRHVPQAFGRAGIQHLPAPFARLRPDIDNPFRLADHIQVVLDQKQRITRRAQLCKRGQQGLRVGRVQARRRFIEHIDHAEQAGMDLRAQPQALVFPRRERLGPPVHLQVAEPELGQHIDPGNHVHGNAACGNGRCVIIRAVGRVGHGGKGRGNAFKRQCPQRCNVHARKRHAQGVGVQPLAVAKRAVGRDHERFRPLAHGRTLRIGESLRHVAPRARERALVGGLQPLRNGALYLRVCKTGINRHAGRFVGEQNPLPRFGGQVAPGAVHVDSHGNQDIAQVLALPRGRPGRHRPFADGQGRVGHQCCLCHVMHAAQPVAARAGPHGGVGRKRFGLQPVETGRIGARA